MFDLTRRHTLAILTAGAAAASVTGLPGEVQAGPAADLWPRWEAHDPASESTIDHAEWGRILDAYLEPREGRANLFDYAAVTSEDRALLQDYLGDMTSRRISKYNRDEQFAYWVNLYNALTIEVMLDHWPVDSIRDINLSGGFFSGLFGAGPWDAELVEIEGESLTLNDIEHRILRPIWQDQRIHYAVNCASIGCPDLNPEPFQAERLEEQLEAAARNYVNDARGAEVENGRLTVSKIYTWYKEDFGDSDRGVIEELKTYAEPGLRQQLEGISRISNDRYDWSTNSPEQEGRS